jgi:hypothetical protein
MTGPLKEATMQKPAEVTTGSTIRCVECETEADGTAEGWRAYLCGGFEGEPLEVLVYCPACDARENSDGP